MATLHHIHHVHYHADEADERRFSAILNTLQRIIAMFEDLETKVAALTSASDAAEALLDGTKAKLDDLH